MKQLYFAIFFISFITASDSITMGGDNRKLGRIQKVTPSNYDHWMQMTKAARTGELPAFLKESRQLNRENVRVSGRVEESKRQLNRSISDSDLIGRWEETSSSEQFTLTVGSDQEIANPLHVFGIDESEGAITIAGENTDPIEATYMPTAFAPIVANFSMDGDQDYPIVEFALLYMTNMDDYVSHPDSIAIIVLHDSVSYSFGTAGGQLMDNVTIFAGDILYEEEPEWGLPMARIIHGITIKDTISLEVIDFMENSETFTLTGEIKHGTIPLMAGVQYPIEDFIGSLWDDGDEDDELWVEKFYVEFLSDNTGRFIDSWEDLEYGWSYIDSSAFAWATWDDTLSITEQHEDWDEDEDEYIVITETIDAIYKIENSVLSILAEFDFCEDEFEDPLSPYACGDSLRFLGLFGLNDVESLIISFSAIHDYDGETGTRTDLVFNQIMPGDGSVIEITSDNAWTDSLVFAWESADHVFGSGDVTYITELSGDLDNFFLMTPNTTDNIWKIPYHHIKYYMDQAGISKATGVWDIRSEGKGKSGTVHGASWDSNSLSFDGTDDYANLGVIPNTELAFADFSIQAWVKTTSTKKQSILFKGDGDGVWEDGEKSLWIEGVGYPWFEGFHNEYIPGTGLTVNDGSWHHIIVTWDYSDTSFTGDAEIYVDGVKTPVDPSYMAVAADNKLDKLYLGSSEQGASNFDGSLKEIALWSGALTESEVINLYNSGSGKDATTVQKANLEGYWKLNDASGDKANNQAEMVIYSENGPYTLTIDASALSVENGGFLPDQFQLHANFPNPFNPTTSIKYDLPKDASVSLMIYDITGREIRHLVNETQNAGFKAIMWDGTNNYGQQVGTGMYLYQIKAGSFVQTRKMILMK